MLAAVIAMLASATPAVPPPRRTSGNFTTLNHGLTFRAPTGSYYCPLPDGSEVTDDGTVILLEKPASCRRSGGLSFARGYLPLRLSRIEIVYGFGVQGATPQRCRTSLRVRILGQMRPICRSRNHGGEVATIEIFFGAGHDVSLNLTLVTGRTRLAQDLAALREVAESARACRSAGGVVRCPDADWY